VVLRGPWDTINVIKVAPTDLAQGSSTTTSTFPAMWARRADSELTTRPRRRNHRLAVWLGQQAREGAEMGFEQYHEPAAELSAEVRTFARMIASMTEEAEAIGWYEQRIALEPDPQAKAIMENAQGEEFKHFGMDLEFLLRRTPKWRIALQTILFTDGDIVQSGEEAEEAENR
jgi:hypothetical protein